MIDPLFVPNLEPFPTWHDLMGKTPNKQTLKPQQQKPERGSTPDNDANVDTPVGDDGDDQSPPPSDTGTHIDVEA
ncbi:MAG: hypothetical protein WD648_01040 [Planctomycetaceae bacterium]